MEVGGRGDLLGYNGNSHVYEYCVNVHGHVFQTFNDKSLGKRLSSSEAAARSKDTRQLNVLTTFKIQNLGILPQTALSHTRFVQPRSKQKLFPSTALNDLLL